MTAILKIDMLMTIAAYLAMEENALEKHEYHDREIYAMAGGTPNYALIGGNSIGAL